MRTNVPVKSRGLPKWLRIGARVVPPLLVAISVTACLGDKSADDYRNSVVSEALARIQGIRGTYRGELLSVENRQSLGFLSLDLTPDTQVQRSSDNLKSERQALVRGTLRFMSSEVNATFSFSQGYYDDESNVFEANVPLQSISPAFAQASARISGRIVNGAFAGTIEVPGFSEYGAQMELVKDGATRVSPGMTHGRSREAVRQNQKFTGTLEYNGQQRAVSLQVSAKEVTSEQRFSNILLPGREVAVTLDLGEGRVAVFNPAYLDFQTGLLSAQLTDRFPKSLTCKREVAGGTTRAMDCHYHADTSNSVVDWTVRLTAEGSGS